MRKFLVLVCVSFALLLAQPTVTAQAEESAIYTVTMNYRVQNDGPTEALDARMIIYLFDNVSGWAEQRVLSEQIEGATLLSAIESTDDNRWVRISLGNLPLGESKTATVVQTLKIKTVELSIDPATVGTSLPQELLVFTSPVDGLFESNAPELQSLALQLTDNTVNLYYKAKQIFEFVVDNLEYVRQPEGNEHGALWGYQNGIGDCTEHSNLFIALLRAAGIPAKVVSGFGYLALYAVGGTADAEQLGHAFAMFYLPNVGWVPADLVWPLNVGSFGKIDYSHIVGATTGGEGIVDDGRIRWPGPGAYKEPYYRSYVGQAPNVTFSFAGGTITPEVLVEPKFGTPSSIRDGILRLTLIVKNTGQQTIDNASASISADQTYFEILTPAQGVGSLTSGSRMVLDFDVRVKEAAYDKSHTFTANVTYGSSYGTFSGTFLAKGDRTISISSPPSASTQQPFDILLLALIAVLIGSVVALAAALLRRR
ncbi:MAG: hypothetical protein E3I12_02770 [Hadesarchaea archaeon]|nr:MAG: hypothetical protein E3I12_02770 [Hadesarchaea archaeon]